MSKQAEAIELARRAYLDALRNETGEAPKKHRELVAAVEVLKEARRGR